jgi:hypothetical protein
LTIVVNGGLSLPDQVESAPIRVKSASGRGVVRKMFYTVQALVRKKQEAQKETV